MVSAPSPRPRPAVHAGRFYPSNPTRLRADVQSYLAQAGRWEAAVPGAVIAPHAGYVYSGVVAASAFAALAPAHARLRRVILIGPSHYEEFDGLAATRTEAFLTPLGPVRVDAAAVERALGLSQVRVLDRVHAPEHALEVELPFLQTVLSDFRLVPLLVGHATPEAVGEVLERLWDGPETGLVVSSDLSHYLEQSAARKQDQATADDIVALREDRLDAAAACGHHAIAGLLAVARRRSLRGQVLDLRNSGDTAGSPERVVGYGAFAFSAAG